VKTALATLIGVAVLLAACGSSNSGSGHGSRGGVTVNISASLSTVDLGQSVTLNWSSTNASSCLATSAPAESDWTALVGTSGSAIVSPASYTGEIYGLTCAGPAGSQATASTSVTVNSAVAAIANSVNGAGNLSNYWTTNNCVLNGTPINTLTVVTPAASINGYTFWVGIDNMGYNPGGAGGFAGNWAATSDGSGMLVTYPSMSCLHQTRVPVSILNIAGSTPAGTFDGELVDQTGATAACSFSLVPPTGNAPAYQQIQCN
jgi:hypothetical protein